MMKTNDEMVADKHPIFKRELEVARRQGAHDERVSRTIDARVRAAQSREGEGRRRRSGVERNIDTRVRTAQAEEGGGRKRSNGVERD